jgi:RNA polymerase sigma-70 factor (ECF subfamily)
MVDESAKLDIERLVAEHHQVVYGYAFRLSGSVADAEDLTQQVFLTAHQRLAQLRKPECARSWLLTILRNRFLKNSRHRQATPATTVGVNLDAIAMQVPPPELFPRDIDGARLQAALAELPPDFRVVLTMYYFEDCSYREIAEGLELPIGTVMSRLARAKGHLRGKLFPPGPRPARRPLPTVVK